jgi:uncharacterized membrane protein YhhN
MLKIILYIFILGVALTDWLAVARGWKKVEYLAKPATIILLMAYLGLMGGFNKMPMILFNSGLIFSLVGDVFLMISFYRFSNRWFLPGLTAFLLAHISYFFGFTLPPGNLPPVLVIGLGIVLALTTARILQRIIAGLHEKGLHRMVCPVRMYAMVITLMLLSAMLTLYRDDWKSSASGLACLGAILFYFSDIVLAWNKFVKPVKNGRVLNMIAYHMGQIVLITGVVLQFGK